ncbi:hypothetical protein BCIN_10g03360 [Botrytis cinerea B05.10]|uniref:Uncharacterized protein n=1 Tax=Botryotinia fuckeliana (strain B05.10) TaxID=332648 RepID=A0A384JUV6_BOTFB|nr:hypothetical protein BCIN_10g03360 [Botrytis cinerea B05.10]ATZ54328.1 hypothetical protein BCIN_10g03360 [Botrytis cinerea B05.10]
MAKQTYLETVCSPSKDAIQLPSIRSLLKGPAGSCTLPAILPIAAQPPVYTQLPIRSEVFPVNQTLTERPPLEFASVQLLDEDENSCRQQLTRSQSLEIRNGQSIRGRSPVEGIPGTKVAVNDAQYLLEIRYRDERLKIHHDLEDIQERICSILEECEQLMKEKNRLQRRSEDIKVMTGTPNETLVKEEMTEDQNLSSSDVIIAIDQAYLKRIIDGEQTHIFRRHLLPAGINRIWVRSGGSLVAEEREIKHICEVKPMRRNFRHSLPNRSGKGYLEFNTRYKDLGNYEFAYKVLSVYNLTCPITKVDLRRHGIDRSAGSKYIYMPTPLLNDRPKESWAKVW